MNDGRSVSLTIAETIPRLLTHSHGRSEPFIEPTETLQTVTRSPLHTPTFVSGGLGPVRRHPIASTYDTTTGAPRHDCMTDIATSRRVASSS